MTIYSLKQKYKDLQYKQSGEEENTISGVLTHSSDLGKAFLFNLRDFDRKSGIQVIVKDKNLLTEEAQKILKEARCGDILTVTGLIFRNYRDELTFNLLNIVKYKSSPNLDEEELFKSFNELLYTCI